MTSSVIEAPAVHNFGPDFQCGRRTLSCKNERVLPNLKSPEGHAQSTNYLYAMF